MINETNFKLQIFNDIANILENNRIAVIDILSEIETSTTATIELNKTIMYLRTFSEELKYIGKTPFGICDIFLPFNNPLYSFCLYAFGCSLAGNKINVRPSRLTAKPLLKIVTLIKKELEQLDIAVLSMDSKEFVDNAIRSKHDVIIFTGKYENALNILSELGENIKFIYCGSGVCPFIISKTADLEEATNEYLHARFYNSGQDCLSAEIVLVDKAVEKEFKEKLLLKLRKMQMYDNSKLNSLVGPLINIESVNNVKNRLKELRKFVIYKGKIDGLIISPFVLELPLDNIQSYQEWFAPIICIAKYDNFDELIFLLNKRNYCLGATYYGKENIDKINIPHIAVNSSLLEMEEKNAHLPFGGYRRSGFVVESGKIKEGPILFSRETSR